MSRVFYPEDYGAKRDGTTNDRPAILAAFAAAQAVGGKVLFSNGVYRTTSEMVYGSKFFSASDLRPGCGSFTDLPSYNGTAYTAATGVTPIVIEGEPGATIWGDFSSGAILWYGVSGNANIIAPGAVHGINFVGQQGYSGGVLQPLDLSTAITGTQYGLVAASYPLRVENIYVRSLYRGLAMTDCYNSKVDGVGFWHVVDAVIAANNNGGKVSSVSGTFAFGTGCVSNGQQANVEKVTTEDAACGVWITGCDDFRLSSTYLEDVYAGHTGFAIQCGINPWVASVAVVKDQVVSNGIHTYFCTTAGTPAGSGGPTGTGTGITDGSAVWSFLSTPSDLTRQCLFLTMTAIHASYQYGSPICFRATQGDLYGLRVYGGAGSGTYLDANSFITYFGNTPDAIALNTGSPNAAALSTYSSVKTVTQGGIRIAGSRDTTHTGLSGLQMGRAGLWCTSGGMLSLSQDNNDTANFQLNIFSGGLVQPYADASGSPGAASMDYVTGRAAIAATASSVVITNAYVAIGAIVTVQYEGASEDVTCTRLRVVVNPSGGSFTVYGNAAATSTVKFSFKVQN